MIRNYIAAFMILLIGGGLAALSIWSIFFKDKYLHVGTTQTICDYNSEYLRYKSHTYIVDNSFLGPSEAYCIASDSEGNLHRVPTNKKLGD